MAPPLDYWRGFFSGARASIFDAIDAAIRVAAADHPDALRARRDAIAERLFTALILLPPPHVSPSPDAALPPPRPKPNQQQRQLLTEGAGSVPGLCSSDDPVAAETSRVKAALSDAQEKTEAELLDLLRRLQQLEFTAETIRITEIGTAVKPLRKHSSKQIRQLVRTLIDGWKAMVDEWVSNGDPVVDHTPQSMDASCLEQEGGLPSPPMDEAALFATPCTSIQLAEFFDEMDDDGNVITNDKGSVQHHPAIQEPVKEQPRMGQSYDPEQNWRLDQSAVEQSRPYDPSDWQIRQQPILEAQGKPSAAASGPERQQRLPFEPRASEIRPKKQQDASMAQRRPKPYIHDQPSSQNGLNSVQANAKLEAAKRKLQEGYQEFNNAKKQRTIQMVDPHDLPKPRNRSMQPCSKLRNNTINNLRNQLGIRR